MEVSDNKATLWVRGADLIDGTPIFDIKPYLPYSDAVATAEAPGFDAPIAHEVIFSQLALNQLAELGFMEDQDLIKAVIAQDPRPAYRAEKLDERVYGLRWKKLDVQFRAADSGFEVVGVSLIID